MKPILQTQHENPETENSASKSIERNLTMNEFITIPDQFRNGTVPYGSAVLMWMGQMGFWIRMGSTVLSIDYFASETGDRQFPPPVEASKVKGISCFLGTHDHLDHIDRPSWKIWSETCPEACFVVPRMHVPSLCGDGFPEKRLIGLNDGESAQIGDITISAVAAAHEFLDRDGQTGLYPCLQYVIEGNGVRIYHAGDTCRYEGMLPKLQAYGKIDAALLPINGRDAKRYRANCIGNMTWQEAADLAGELRPGVVIPGHYDMFAGNSADPAPFADYLDAKYGSGVPCLIPQHAEFITITAAGI